MSDVKWKELTLHATTEAGSAGPADDAADLSDEALARQALRAVIQDPTAPAAARAQAARTLLELAGQLGRHADPPRRTDAPLVSQSREDLERELHALTGGALPGIDAPA